jgi:hypothetical protein
MTRDRHPDIFSRDLSEKLAVNNVALKAYLLILDRWGSVADVGVRSERASSRCPCSLSQCGVNFLRVEMDLRFWLRAALIRSCCALIASAVVWRRWLRRLGELVHFLPKRLGVGRNCSCTLRLRHRRRFFQYH